MDTKLSIEIVDNTLYMTFQGEVTLTHTPSMKPETDRALEAGGFDSVVVNLVKTIAMDSSGIGFLVTLNTSIKKKGKSMILYKPGVQVRKTLEMVQLLDYFQIASTEDELWSLLPE